MIKLAIVSPCYNEEEVLETSVKRLTALYEQLIKDKKISEDSFFLFVNDGSRDKTWDIICRLHQENKFVCGLNLAHNVGHQSAIMAGMMTAKDRADAAITIDADLQDDPDAIIEMARQFKAGADIVYGVRRERKTDTWFKRVSAQAFYKLMRTADKDIIYNHADFRLMSDRAVRALMQYDERNMFLRGMVRQLGFSEGRVYYDRTARTAGESKYPLGKMLSFSIDGITSFSTAPLKFITVAGLLMTVVALVFIVYGLVAHFGGKTIVGWTSLMVSLWFIGGVVTTGVGITGIYIGKIYTEVKRRPRYFVDKKINL